jgi:hypothetical protein
MRIWSFHPRYLDAKGLVAVWREALLAQAVLRGRTRGYTNHPQLTRFRDAASPLGSIAEYLRTVYDEATTRGYEFSRERVSRARSAERLSVTTGQLDFEWRHFLRKARSRAPYVYRQIRAVTRPDAHPLFRVVTGRVASWEKGEQA